MQGKNFFAGNGCVRCSQVSRSPFSASASNLRAASSLRAMLKLLDKPLSVSFRLLVYGFLAFSNSAGNFDDILLWPRSKVIHLKVKDELDPLKNWTLVMDLREAKEPNRPTSSTDSITITTVRCPYFLPHTKLFDETEGCLHNGSMYAETSFTDPQALQPTYSFLLFSFS